MLKHKLDRNWLHNRLALFVCTLALTAFGSFLPSSVALAQEPPSTLQLLEPYNGVVQLYLDGDSAAYRGSITVRSTFTRPVTGTQLINLTDLVPTTGIGRPILAADIAVTTTDGQPDALMPGMSKRFGLRVPKPALPGIYTGVVELYYPGALPYQIQPITLTLNAAIPTLNITPTELQLVRSGITGLYKGTFTLAAVHGEVQKLLFSPTALRHDAYNTLIFADAIQITPTTATLSAGQPAQQFTVSVIPSESGKFSGKLYFSYFGSAAERAMGNALIALTVDAQTPAHLVFSDTAKLQVTTHIGAVFSETLYLRESSTANAAYSVTLSLGNLSVAGDDARVLPGNVIKLSTPITINAGQFAQAFLTIDLCQAQPFFMLFSHCTTRPGKYTGSLILQSTNTPNMLLPAEISLKHRLGGWPLVVLLLGIVVGLYLTWYAEIQDRDRMLIQLDRLRRQVDSELGKPFHTFFGDEASRKLDAAEDLAQIDWKTHQNRITALKDEVAEYRARWQEWGPDLEMQLQIINNWLDKLDFYQGYALADATVAEFRTLHDKRCTFQDANEFKKAIEGAVVHAQVFVHIHDVLLALEAQLGTLGSSLEAVTADALQKRAATRHESLRNIVDVTQLAPLSAELEAINKEFVAAYQAWPDFLYTRCEPATRQLLAELSSTQHRNWAILQVKFTRELETAANYMQDRMHLDKASQIAYNTWRALRACKDILLPIALEVDQQQFNNTTTAAWTAVETILHEVIQWLVTQEYAQTPMPDFDKYLLTDQIPKLYAALSQAKASVIPNPGQPLAPQKPPRFPTTQDVGSRSAVREVQSLNITPSSPKRFPGWRDFQNQIRKRFTQIWQSAGQLFTPRVRYTFAGAIVFIVLVLVLLQLGVETQYLNDATFGDSFLDYIALFAWGVGANVTATGVVQLLQRLNFSMVLPIGNKG